MNLNNPTHYDTHFMNYIFVFYFLSTNVYEYESSLVH